VPGTPASPQLHKNDWYVQHARRLLAERAAVTLDRVAFVEGRSGRALTWGAISARADQWTGADPHAVVGLPRCELVVQRQREGAALAAGVPVAPLNPDAPAAEIDAQMLAFRRTGAAGAALLMTSSGTTGPPKTIPLTERQLLYVAGQVAAHHQLGAGDRGYCPLPLFHINAIVVGVLSTLVAGSSLVLDGRFSARSCWETVDGHGATWLNLVPAIIGILADAPADGPAAAPGRSRPAVRFARSASAPLPPATAERFQRRFGISVLETYGMTEAASQIAANPLDPASRRPGSVGRPVGVEVRIVDGNVEIRGPSVSGHHDTWLRTGDLGRLDEDGFLYLTGRAGDVINRAGEKVFPREVEEVLLEDRRVRAAVVVGRPHTVLGEEPVAFVVVDATPRERAELVEALARRCGRALSPFKRPAEITVAETLPAGPTGKVRRAELRRLALEGATPP